MGLQGEICDWINDRSHRRTSWLPLMLCRSDQKNIVPGKEMTSSSSILSHFIVFIFYCVSFYLFTEDYKRGYYHWLNQYHCSVWPRMLHLFLEVILERRKNKITSTPKKISRKLLNAVENRAIGANRKGVCCLYKQQTTQSIKNK